MKIKLRHIKLLLILILVVGLYSFSKVRNDNRHTKDVKVLFLGDNNLFITEQNVSKLLIQNQKTLTDKPKEIIDLNELEGALNANPMIKEAQVFMSLDGVITAEIEQKKPIARVSTNASYYIDDQGSYMPLSSNYSARVPLVTGFIYKNDLGAVYEMAKHVQEDEFLLQHVTQIHQNEDRSLDLYFRLQDFKVELGQANLLDKKINNLKAFYKKALKDNTLKNYSVVNLRFDKQVICTKK